jgi:DNA polymerase-3 subunit delta'
MALKDVIGQDRAMGMILRTLGENKVPSAYLFSGESGIGKRYAALNLAKAVNCLNPVTSTKPQGLDEGQKHCSLLIDACDGCISCKKIDSGTHPDLMVITPEKGEIRVGEIRKVEEALSFKPYEGRRKVVIIDDADTMNQSAANAFLKTLEEPPDESLLILIAANPDMLPDTIRSRCSCIRFVPLSPRACEQVIRTVLGKPLSVAGQDKKRPEPSAPDMTTMVRLSMGRPGLALSSDLGKERERFFSLLDAMVRGEHEAWRDREDMEQWLDMLLILIRDMTVMRVAGSEEKGHSGASDLTPCGNILFNADRGDVLRGTAKSGSIKGIIELYDAITLLKRQLGFNLNKAITWNYVSTLVKTVMKAG